MDGQLKRPGVGYETEGDDAMPKIIQIDKDAYERLEEARRSEESVSEVIKRCVRPVRSAEDVLDILRKASIADETLEAIDESVTRRRRTPRRRRT